MDKKELKRIYADNDLRKLAGGESLFLFALFYFPQIFTRKTAEFHMDMCKTLDNDEFQRVLFLMFRESGKTVYAKIKFIQNICYKKKRFQIFCCFDKNKARSNLFDIARQLQTNKLLISDFGQLFYEVKDTKQSTRKTIGEFITANDIKCLAFSIGESPRGLLYGAQDGEFRPDFWILDDIDVLKAVQNIEVINKSWQWFTEELLPGASKDSTIIVLGNRLKRDGLIPRLEDKIGVSMTTIEQGYGDHEGSGWKYSNVPVMKGEEITWPDRFALNKKEAKEGQEWLYGEGSKMEDYGSISFSSQLLNVIAKEDRIFDTSKIDRFVDHPPLSSMNIFMASDFAISEKKSADETVHIVVGVDKKNHIWILDIFNSRVLPKESIDKLFEIQYKWKPMRYGLETVSFQKSMKYAIEDKQRELGQYFALDELKSDEKKYERVLGLQPMVELGKLHVKRDFTLRKIGKENIIDQLQDFPYGKHDDIIDALAYTLQLAFPVYTTNK